MNHQIEFGKTYTGLNGEQFTVTGLNLSDRRESLHSIDYRLADGRNGETSPNTFHRWIWGD